MSKLFKIMIWNSSFFLSSPLDDIKTWKRIPYQWSFCGEPTGHSHSVNNVGFWCFLLFTWTCLWTNRVARDFRSYDAHVISFYFPHWTDISQNHITDRDLFSLTLYVYFDMSAKPTNAQEFLTMAAFTKAGTYEEMNGIQTWWTTTLL